MDLLKYLFMICLFQPLAALGCPTCTTLVGQQVWQGIFNAQFFVNFFIVTLPFIILTFFIILVYYGVPRIIQLFFNQTP
jgi:hypothetical protein